MSVAPAIRVPVTDSTCAHEGAVKKTEAMKPHTPRIPSDGLYVNKGWGKAITLSTIAGGAALGASVGASEGGGVNGALFGGLVGAVAGAFAGDVAVGFTHKPNRNFMLAMTGVTTVIGAIGGGAKNSVPGALIGLAGGLVLSGFLQNMYNNTWK